LQIFSLSIQVLAENCKKRTDKSPKNWLKSTNIALQTQKPCLGYVFSNRISFSAIQKIKK
jgi:hypothetical protein